MNNYTPIWGKIDINFKKSSWIFIIIPKDTKSQKSDFDTLGR